MLSGGVEWTPPAPEGAADAGLRVLLIDGDDDEAETTLRLVEQTFGNRCHVDRVSATSQAAEWVERNAHDIYIIGDGRKTGDTLEFVRSGAGAGSRRSIIVLARNGNSDLDLHAVDAGAADCIPKEELTAKILERSVRHALLREHGANRARCEISRLTAEIARLNSLRDTNHRFVDNACHDFRSPLTVVKEFASIIAEGLAGDVNEEQAEFLEIILTRVDQLSQMIDAILDASRLESDLIGVKREEHAPADLIEKAWPTLKQLASSHGAEISLNIDEQLPKVFADSESVGRILVNLITNAAKFTGESGKIDVWARRDPDENAVRIGVTDNGPGISPEEVKLIFDRFRQVENDEAARQKGFGLGLHIASELARVNFGTLSVESEPRKGSTFAFTLPVFDVSALIPLHFRFLKTSRHGFRNVSIAAVTAGRESKPEALADVERFLNRQLRSYDLLVRLNDATWLACFACDEGGLTKTTDRIKISYSEHNRNRPAGVLPSISFSPIGSWSLSKRLDGLSEAIRSAYALDHDASGAH